MSVCSVKDYVCECGKHFTNSQSFNGHRCHCVVHLKLKGTYEWHRLLQQKFSSVASIAASAARLAKKQAQLEQWIAEKHTCEHCGKLMTTKYASGRFCSRACANSKHHTEETKLRISSALTGRSFSSSLANVPARVCRVCGTTFVSRAYQGDTCSSSCFDALLFSLAQDLHSQAEQSKQELYSSLHQDLEQFRLNSTDSVDGLLAQLDDDGKLKNRYFAKCANARLEGLQCRLTLYEYCLLLKFANLHSSDLGFSGRHYVLARFNDSGDYRYGFCRFVTQIENAQERFKPLSTYVNYLRYNVKALKQLLSRIEEKDYEN